MGKCVSKHPSAITIASAEYLTSNNKIFIENYTDSITIKNENTNSDNSIYINSEYIPIPTTETDILTVNPATTTATTVQTTRKYKKYSKNDKNLSNNTIVIEDYKNKKTKCQKEQQKQYQNNNDKNSKNDGNKSKKRKFSTKNEKSEIVVVTNRNIVKNLTSQISKFTITNSCINPTIEPTATEINCYSKDNIIDFQNKENIHVDNDSSILQQSTIIKPDFDKIKNFDNQKLSEKEQINNNDNTTLKIHSNGNNNNNNNNNTIEILNSCNSNNSHDDNNDDDNNQHDNENHDTKAIAGISFCNNNYFNKKLKKLPLTKENSKNQNKCNTKNCSNYYYNSINNSTNSIGNRNGNHNTNGNGILFSAKKISCLSKNESQDSLDTDEILKSLNTKKSHSNKIDENKNNNNQNENDKENILIQNDEEEELKEVARQDEEVIKENNFSLHNEGQTESKKKSKNIGPDTKGTAMSFGFRKKLNNTPKKQKFLKDKHNIKDNCNNSDNVATDGTIITNPVLKDDLNNFHDKNGNSDTIDATTNITATQQKFNSTTIKNTFDKNETTWATHRTATQLSQNKEHISLMGGGNVNGSGGGSGGGNNFGNNRNRFGFRSANIIRPASTGIPAPSIMTELQDNTNNNNNNNNSNNNTVTVKRRSKSASGVSSSRENSYSSDNEKNNRNNNGGVGGIGNVAGGNIITKRSTLVNRNNDQQQQQQKVVNEVRFAENPKINYITSVHDIDDEYNSRPHWKQQNDIRRSGGMTSEMLRNQFFNSGCNAPMSSGMMNRHGNMMNQNQIITTGMHTNVIVKPKPIMTTTTVTACKYTLHTASLPKPQYPVPISLTTTAPSSSSSMDIKSAKQMVNNNRKGVFGPRDISTDSGLSSMDNTIDSSNASRSSVLRSISSTKASASGTSSNGGSPKKLSKNRPRNLEMVISGRHKFEVRDLDALSSCDNVEPLALPKLPSVFSSENQQLAPLSGLVRSNTILSRDSASTTQESTPEDMRKTSRTNSESDSINEEKLFRDRSTAEKDTNKNSTIGLTSSKNSSPASSRASWCQAGESLAIKDCSSLSISSSDDSKDNHLGKTFTIQTEEISSITFDEKPSIFSSLTDSSAIFPKVSKNYALNNNDENIVDNKFDFLISDFEAQTKQNQNEEQNLQEKQFERPKSITKDVGDPIKFAEMAAAVSDVLLDDETSPTDSLVSSTESEEAMLKKTKKKTNEELPEKDIDEISPELDPCSPLSPGTPTHASNSLSLSDIGKDFLIDDEIADQPALLFSDKKNDTIEGGQHTTNSMTDTTPTLMESIGNNAVSQRSTKSNSKSRNLMQAAIELSLRTPISLRKATMLSKAESWDTLSPCESIASDDLMMDFETSSMDSIDRVSQSIKGVNASALKAFDDAELLAEFETKGDEMIREWNNILRVHRTGKDSIISHLPARATRLLNRSRLQQQTQLGSTAGSDSPKSNDSFNLNRKNTSSSRTSSLHLSNREINSSSDDLLLYDKSFRNSMIQDVLYFKKQLLRLRRILQETDTLNPFEVNNGQFFASPVHGTTGAATTTTAQSAITNNQQQQHQSTKNNHGGSGNSISSNQSDLLAQQYFVGSSGGSDNEKHFGNSLQSLTSLDDPIQELADLRRQVVYLQSQVDDRERTIRFQKNLIEKLENESEKSRESFANPSLNASALEKEVVNTATQTERVRPLSIGQEGLSRSKPEYTSYTINIPNSGSSTTTTTTEIISPSVTGINFFNSNNNHHPTSRRHTVISTTFTNLSNNHSTMLPSTNNNNNNNNNHSIINGNNNNNINNNNHNNNSYRRASIPWEKLIYKPVKTTLIGEPISTINYINSNNNNIKNIINDKNNDNSNNNIDKNNSPIIPPTILKTTTTIISSQIDKNNKKNLLNNKMIDSTKRYQNEENGKIKENYLLNGNNGGIENGRCEQNQSIYQKQQQTQMQQQQQKQQQQHSTNMLSNSINNNIQIDCNNATILNKNLLQNGGNFNNNEIDINMKINKNSSNSNGIMKFNSDNQYNGNARNSKLNNLKYNFINNNNNTNNNNNNNNNNCFDVIVTKTNTNKTTSNNGSVTTIV
ncbi:probable serine/threonine-protein kinase DDB_G0282963 isoform X3 [Condylostylus longicornis]|uniref:probable serine/threonine-protein kinase DDB_G0282963 isoform X3 n=1 Tax=Condylostylus longicornis TaxID=2530218 RepID=UPI00244DDBD1|nr:probable serine/threonine-protein kinase DDB_G0282963 isoform X3 [Condylostylus longicornis]